MLCFIEVLYADSFELFVRQFVNCVPLGSVTGALLVAPDGTIFGWFIMIYLALHSSLHLKYHTPLAVVTDWFQQVNVISCWLSGLMGYLLNHSYAELKLGFESVAGSIVGPVVHGLFTVGS